MNLSKTSQAILLLTSYFSQPARNDVKPLTNSEWGRFALWLKNKAITPADLLEQNADAGLFSGWEDNQIGVERLQALLNRGHSLALAMEKWQRAGLWVVTRSDPDYPWRLKQRLKNDCPPVLFGCGDRGLMNTGGIAVVGSRNAAHEDLTFTHAIGEQAANEMLAVISGGARGIDETAMLAALQRGGKVIGVMADSLLNAATSIKWRKALMHGQLLLLSPFYPEAGFNVGNAMARNKFIYCLADSALVVHAGKKGGTLNGARENQKKRWVPMWVKPSNDPSASNNELIAQGANQYEGDSTHPPLSTLQTSSQEKTSLSAHEPQGELFDTIRQPDVLSSEDTFSQNDESAESLQYAKPHKPLESSFSSAKEPSPLPDFYQRFKIVLAHLAREPVSVEVLLNATHLHKSQLTLWLKQASDEGVVKKLTRPVRYQWVNQEANNTHN